MDRNTLYAINATGVPKPGYVLDPGKAPGNVTVRVYWRWENQDEDYLNPQPVFITPSDIRTGPVCHDRPVGTADVLQPWADYCAQVKAERARMIAERDAADLAEQQAKDDLVGRIEAVGELLDTPRLEGSNYIDQSDLHWLARSGRINRYSAMHVLRLVEAIVANYDITERVVIPDEKG